MIAIELRADGLGVAAPMTFAREPPRLVTIAVDRTHHEKEFRAYIQRFAVGLVV